MNADEEFYVGYLDRSAPATSRFARRTALGLVAVALGLGALFAMSQSRWGSGSFEFGTVRTLTGVYRAGPVAHLEIAHPGGRSTAARWLLVGEGKHGVPGAWARFDGQAVALEGTLIARGATTMVEVAGAGPRPDAGSAPTGAEAPRAHGRRTVVGEIVDSKCWLGVMNPGELRTHRACATLCVRGGVPPLVAVWDAADTPGQLLLLGAAGEPIHDRALPWIALPVELEGELWQLGELWFLHLDPDGIRRWAP
ncbi:MAG: hypothetical protein GC161_05275 [Planctomycetaceae bacterium]|nr:hypothetical protein [Planctomycetaceae bacterium]